MSLSVPASVDLPSIVYRTVARNWAEGGAATNVNRSSQNWRWMLQPHIGATNCSPEVVLERAIAAACLAEGRDDWANQVPVASGLIAGAADGRRAIDLAQRRGEQHYELIELKVATDTPLYAAVELLGYASLWLLAREAPPAHAPSLLTADRIDLRVLAPATFYAPFRLAGLERSVDTGTRSLGHANGLAITFAFDVLPEGLVKQPARNEALLQTLAKRRRLHAGD
ncbi:hypothetical protein [Sphingomonas aerophila]|nr:hypothetical protein [Sphingomonas aerophila]